jgi:D-xylose transport system substrate-binding protein
VIILKKVILILFLILAVIALTGCTPKVSAPTNQTQNKHVVIGLSLDTLRTERWQTDKALFTAKAEELGASVIAVSADLDADVQATQVDDLILQGVNVLVIVATDGEKASALVEKAHKAGIKVIAYDRLIKNSDLDYYISFDNIKVGEEEAQKVLDVVSKGNFVYLGGSPTDNNAFLVKNGSFKVLQPKIDSGDIKIVLNVFDDGWKSDEAYRQLNDYLNANVNVHVDAVIAANDGTAAGAIQALSGHGLAGKVPVSGQDASLGACQKIVEGTQTVTVYKPLKNIAYKAAEMAVAIAKDDSIDTNSITNNGKIDVPSYLLDVVAVTKENMINTVIKDGFQSYQDVYQNVPESARPPNPV